MQYMRGSLKPTRSPRCLLVCMAGTQEAVTGQRSAQRMPGRGPGPHVPNHQHLCWRLFDGPSRLLVPPRCSRAGAGSIQGPRSPELPGMRTEPARCGLSDHHHQTQAASWEACLASVIFTWSKRHGGFGTCVDDGTLSALHHCLAEHFGQFLRGSSIVSI